MIEEKNVKRAFVNMLFKIKNSIKLKIILTYIMSLIIVYVVTWLVLSVFLFQPLAKDRKQNMINISDKIVEDVRTIRESYDNILFRLISNHNIYQDLSTKCTDYEEVWTALTNIKYTLSEEVARSSVIKKLQIYQRGSDIGQDGRFVLSDTFDEEKLQNTKWIQETIDGTVLLCKYRKISYLYNNVEAYMKIAIKSQEAFGRVMELDGEISGLVYLTNEKNIILAASDEDTLGQNIYQVLPTGYIKLRPGEITSYDSNLIMKDQADDWNVWLVVSSNQLETKVNYAKVVVGIILLGYGLFSALALSMLLNHVFGRLHKLGTKMELIQGDISYVAVPEKGDEVTILEVQYNSMMEKLERVIDEMVEVKSQKQKFEFKSLESQINPHFLYNTLGVMRWEAIDCQNSKLVNMIDNLTTFYRLSLNRGKGVLNIEQELKLVRAYIDIQQMRWDNVVEVEFRVDSNLEKIMIPKMILQPLVENIWLHGNITAESNRKIKILVQDAGLYVIFKIWDNGDGIEKELLEDFKTKPADEDSFGIGIQFIRNILKYYYEEDFKYEVVSKTNLGTLVTLTLPKKLEC